MNFPSAQKEKKPHYYSLRYLEVTHGCLLEIESSTYCNRIIKVETVETLQSRHPRQHLIIERLAYAHATQVLL